MSMGLMKEMVATRQQTLTIEAAQERRLRQADGAGPAQGSPAQRHALVPAAVRSVVATLAAVVLTGR